MRAQRRHLIDQVMAEHDRIYGGSDIKRAGFKAHLEQFSDEEILAELPKLRKEPAQ